MVSRLELYYGIYALLVFDNLAVGFDTSDR
jgi:hypothetical protein